MEKAATITTIMNAEPFSPEVLNGIFRISPRNTEHVLSRESSILEFKESFGWRSLPEYLKTAAAFANSRGGYIVFGITHSPHRLIGLNESGLTSFSSLEPAKLTEHLNDYFCPEIKWTMNVHEMGDKSFGILYFYEAEEKPVVCIKNGDDMKESDMFYRYRGRSQRIKYQELRSIMNHMREKEQQLWMTQILRVAKIGIHNTAIFDLTPGKVTGKSGSFLIEESLLNRLSFIKEGEFSEREGEPTLKLIGTVEPVSTLTLMGKKQIIKETKIITLSDIVLCFLKQERVSDPENYIKQICLGTTAYLPVYFYINQANIEIEKVIMMIDAIVTHSQAKEILKRRLSKSTTQWIHVSGYNSIVSDAKRRYKQEIIDKSVNPEIEGQKLIYCLQALRGFSLEEIRTFSDTIFKFLTMCFNKHYEDRISGVTDNIRRAICWIDEALFMKHQV